MHAYTNVRVQPHTHACTRVHTTHTQMDWRLTLPHRPRSPPKSASRPSETLSFLLRLSLWKESAPSPAAALRWGSPLSQELLPLLEASTAQEFILVSGVPPRATAFQVSRAPSPAPAQAQASPPPRVPPRCPSPLSLPVVLPSSSRGKMGLLLWLPGPEGF